MERLSWQPYSPGTEISYTFKDPTPCENSIPCKFIFIQFRDDKGDLVLINGQRYITSSIELIPGSTPTPTSEPAANIPAPLPNDSPNCPIENPKPYDIGTLYTMCSVDQLARFDLKWLVDFPNEILIDIGRRKGDLGGFLANFSGERLIGAPPYSGSGFSLEILRELPEWRKQQLPGYIQDQL